MECIYVRVIFINKYKIQNTCITCKLFFVLEDSRVKR